MTVNIASDLDVWENSAIYWLIDCFVALNDSAFKLNVFYLFVWVVVTKWLTLQTFDV